MAKANQEQSNNEVVTTMTGADLITKMGSKSAAIRYLIAEGKSRGEVAKFLGIRYQHVRNVMITPLKRATVAVETKKD